MKQMYLLACALLLSVPSLAGETRVEVVTKTTKSWDGAQLPAYPGGQPEVTILRITIPAGVKLPMHKHPVINAGLLLTGELTVTTKSGDVITLGAGDSIVELVDKWHFGANTGPSEAEIVVFYAGVEGAPITLGQDSDQ